MKKLRLPISFALMLVIMLIGVASFEEIRAAQPTTSVQTASLQTEEATQPVSPTLAIPFLEEWSASPHADLTAEAFIHWNEEDPAEIPESCAKCHSTSGYIDFLGADGSEAQVVDQPVPVGAEHGVEGVACVACHNDVTHVKDSVVMPSGIELTGLGDEARCMECHQGRQSGPGVDEAIASAGADDMDAVNADLRFQNIHYYAAAATKYGTLAKGGYEYEFKTYDANFTHVEGYETCIECHNSHTLELPLEECATCHEDVEEIEDIRDIRMAGSQVDYDGDEDVEEGIYYELQGVQEALYTGMQAYASSVAGTAITYDSASYPYFFIDADANGTKDEGDTEGFNAWTPRLLKAAYNYQTSLKDPGAYAHGGKYIIQLLYDSLEDLNTAIAEPVDMTAMRRIDAGHFAGSEEAFRHWDADGGVVPGSCAKCHTGTGLPMFLAEGAVISQPASNGLECATCHNDLVEWTRYEVETVRFPSGAMIDSGDADMNLCMNCHQGRESTVSVDRLIGDLAADEISDSLRFLNIHYFAAGATRFGTEAKGAYEYADMSYVGLFDHANVNSCNDCHMTHGLEVEWENCAECHDDIAIEGPEDLLDIRYEFGDYDGNGDEEEGVAHEIEALRGMLYEAIQSYATDTVGTGILYVDTTHPYFFADTNGNGTAEPEEVNRENQFASWTPRLLRAAYNYQYVTKDPGAFVHNPKYIVQILQDSLADLGADVSAMTRPEVESD